MPIKDVIIAALSRPAGRVVDGPVRDIVASALKERGYASPAEVSALKDEIAAVRGQASALTPRLDQLDARLDEARKEAASLREALAAAASAASEARARADVAEQASAALSAEVARLTAESEALKASLAAAPAPGAPAAAASAPACRVGGCGVPAVANGFCREHQLRWRSGRLPGFVSPEGLVDVDGRPGRADLASAGLPYVIADGRLKVAGRYAAVTLL